ncbi:hypothetical protein, partial [Bacillus cereus]|uniref:hypothetical protein n=1 Tax=Bacillus cereus TaxID=1396 RepID=UPI001C5558ED
FKTVKLFNKQYDFISKLMLYLKDPALIVVCISFTGTSSFASLFCYLFDFFMLTFYDFSAMSAE